MHGAKKDQRLNLVVLAHAFNLIPLSPEWCSAALTLSRENLAIFDDFSLWQFCSIQYVLCVCPTATGKSELRRRSSLDSTDIEHIHVDGDLEYAVVTKVRGGAIGVNQILIAFSRK